jgi:hypothetical protein
MSDPRRLLDDGSEASPALRALLSSARRADDPRADQIEALSARLEDSGVPLAPIPRMAPPPPPVATAVARASRAAIAARTSAMVIGLGVLCGGALYVRAIRNDAHPQAEMPSTIELDARPAPSAVAPPLPDDPPIEQPGPQPSPTPSLGSASPPPRPAPLSRKARGAGDSEAETKLVVEAGAALVRDDAAAALSLTRQHLAQFPRGAHAEERDRIAIEALARLGGLDDARAAASRFFLRYPHSIYRSRIEGLVR